MGKIKKTLFVGSIMGAGLIWLTSTKKGKEVRDQLLDEAAAIYEDVKNKILSSGVAKKVSKSQYTQMVRDAVEKYSKGKKIMAPLKALVIEMILAQWDSLRDEVEKTKKSVAPKRKLLRRKNKTA